MRPGKFYIDREGSRWCCYKVNYTAEDHCRAHAIRVNDGRTEYFYSDGRYDQDGKSGLTLISPA